MTFSYYLALAVLFLLPPVAYEQHSSGLIGHIGSLQDKPGQHDQWDLLLRKHVTASGDVNYSGLKQDIELLEEYLSALSANAPDENASREEKLVYYINLYNATTVKLILDHYPVKSIKDIKNPWDKKSIKVGAKLISLGAIEHKILRKLDEPRIHFAINCASYSCPKLQNRAYTLDKLEAQLEEASIAFVNDPGKNRISASGAEISKIFKWYKSDFTEKGSLVDFINIYSNVSVNSEVNVRYINYDWSLNEAK
ncbi:MAG: DUF547 domain-containing protein [Flavobacteriaceae bacterium]